MKLQEFRERINVFLHPHRDRVLSTLKAAHVLGQPVRIWLPRGLLRVSAGIRHRSAASSA